MIGVLCFSLFSVACNDSSSSDSDKPSYTYSESDDGDISNPSFSFGTLTTELTAYPKTSVTGWTKSVDTSATSLSSSYGAVNVTADGWEELMNILYKNTAMKAYATGKQNSLPLSETEIKSEIKKSAKYNPDGDDDYSPTSDEIKEYVINKYFKNVDVDNTDDVTAQSDWLFANPGVRPGASDNVVYMLNNYGSGDNYGFGTSQKITSSSEITLNKGEYGKISVWVKTQNVHAETSTTNPYYANIRLTNTFNGSTQSEYAITNIVADEWTQYVIYVKADEYFDCTIKLALGLGYGINGATEGTVYFDDVEFTHLDKETFENAVNGKNRDSETSFVYNSTSKTLINANTLDVDGDATNGYKMTGYAYYDMTFANYLTSYEETSTYFRNDVVIDETSEFTKSNTGASGDKLNSDKPTITDVTTDLPYDGATARKITLEKQSYTFKWKSDDFRVNCEEYAYVSFYVKNKLSTLGSTDVTVNVVDVNPKDVTDNTVNAAVANVSTVNDEWQKVDLVIKNNFAADKTDETGEPYPTRSFEIQLVIGPSDVASAVNPAEYASGTVYVSSLILAKGTTVTNDTASEAEDRLYDLYSMLSSSASASVALYSGRENDYTDSSDSETYSLTPVASDFGTIINYPTNATGYYGIVANHFYVKEDGENVEKDINTRTRGDANGSYAGLINTKYLNNYSISGLSEALNFTVGQDDIQPLMIYNSVEDRYGFVGEPNTISASAYAKVSVTLRVVDDAVAYIYLVDVANNSKEILTFDTFTDVDGNEHDGEQMKLMLKVNKDVMGNKNWITVNFYVATGASSKNFRVEVWNGGRDDGDQSTISKGFVFIKDISITTSGAFTEASRQPDTFSVSGNPLYEIGKSNLDNLYSYKRQLTELEEQYNSEKSGSSSDVSYSPNYVWAQNDTMIYAIYNTVDPVEVDPYADEETDDTASDGCTAETDPSTFWLSFSSILLGVALIIAIVMLFIKNIRRRRKANASDAKSHYKVVSRVKSKKDAAKKAKAVESDKIEEEQPESEEIVEDTPEEQPEATNVDTEKSEDALDSYVYGEVEVFGEENEDKKD